MLGKNLFFLSALLCGLLGGCASIHGNCKPALFPYVEYSHKAELRPLNDSYSQGNDTEIVEFCALKIAIPRGWRCEEPFEKTMRLFTNDKSRSVIVSYELSTTIKTQDLAEIKLIGCDCPKPNVPQEEKTSKDFFTDIYLFTADQMDSIAEPTLWHYYVLWSKTSILRDAIEMVHYQGNNLEAFRHDSDTTRNVKTTITLFHKKAEPNYYTIAGTFHDNAFFDRFVGLIDTLNP
jgi:hypothetical protein